MENNVQALITFDTSYNKILDFLDKKYGEDSSYPQSSDSTVTEIAIEIGDDNDMFTHTVGVNKLGKHEFRRFHVGLDMKPSPHSLEIITSIVEEFGGYLLVDGELKFLGTYMTETEFNEMQCIGVATKRYWALGIARKMDEYGKEISVFYPGDAPQIIDTDVDEYFHFVGGEFNMERIDNIYDGMPFHEAWLAMEARKKPIIKEIEFQDV